MNYFRERILEPILIPLAAGLLILFGALNLSRLFLAAGGSLAVAVAGGISTAILLGAVYATTREQIERGTLLAGAAVLGIVLAGAGLVAQEVDLEHAEDPAGGEDGVAVSSVVDVPAADIDFPVEEFEAGPGVIQFNYENQGEILHTLVIEGFEDQFELEVSENGEVDSGTFELSEGEFVLYCDIPGHRAAGMEGALTVEEGLGEAPAEGEGGEATAGEPDLSVTAVDIDLGEDAYEVQADDVSVEYVNEGQTRHTLVVEGREEDFFLEVAANGDVDQGTISLESGDYVLYCDVPGHRAAGMEATLTAS